MIEHSWSTTSWQKWMLSCMWPDFRDEVAFEAGWERAMETGPWRPSLHWHGMKMAVRGYNAAFLSSSFFTGNTLMSISSDVRSIWCINQRPFLSTLLSKTTWKIHHLNPATQQTYPPVSQTGTKHRRPHSGSQSSAITLLSSSGHGQAGAHGSWSWHFVSDLSPSANFMSREDSMQHQLSPFIWMVI